MAERNSPVIIASGQLLPHLPSPFPKALLLTLALVFSSLLGSPSRSQPCAEQEAVDSAVLPEANPSGGPTAHCWLSRLGVSSFPRHQERVGCWFFLLSDSLSFACSCGPWPQFLKSVPKLPTNFNDSAEYSPFWFLERWGFLFFFFPLRSTLLTSIGLTKKLTWVILYHSTGKPK